MTKNDRDEFPAEEDAREDGLLAIGGDLSEARLINAYRRGIFPWYGKRGPILWWSPDPRCVLFPEKFKPSHSLKKMLRQRRFHWTLDTAFERVISECAAPRNCTNDTWITADMAQAYINLYHAGIAHSAEVWHHDKLVGGLYGVAIGGVFFGESMFSRVPNASKIALALLIDQLLQWGFCLIDCQVSSAHLIGLGAEEIPRTEFIKHLQCALDFPGNPEPW